MPGSRAARAEARARKACGLSRLVRARARAPRSDAGLRAIHAVAANGRRDRRALAWHRALASKSLRSVVCALPGCNTDDADAARALLPAVRSPAHELGQ